MINVLQIICDFVLNFFHLSSKAFVKHYLYCHCSTIKLNWIAISLCELVKTNIYYFIMSYVAEERIWSSRNERLFNINTGRFFMGFDNKQYIYQRRKQKRCMKRAVGFIGALSSSKWSLCIGKKQWENNNKLCLKHHINLGVPEDHLSCENYHIT